jgi:pimeloyl-ACP methyl ester carboxylesterase
MQISKIITMIIGFLAFSTTALSQKIEYGNNPLVGQYFDVGNCKLYYEIYGQGKPIVLLHGGVYGYIDEFEPFIEKFKLTNQVICIATRGHGKSEIGHTQYSYTQRAEDAYKIIRSITQDSLTVLGFSDGGVSAFKFAALHPELVQKLIVIGAGDLPKIPVGKKRYEQYSPESLMKADADFFKSRLALMPEPKRWGESLKMLNQMYNIEYESVETFSKIKCPTLIIGGDKDEFTTTEEFVKCKKSIKNAQLSIIPGCGHVVFFCNFPAVWSSIEPFLRK